MNWFSKRVKRVALWWMFPRLYFAARLDTEAYRERNARIVDHLEIHFDCFLPQRDGQLLTQLIVDGMDPALAEAHVVAADLRALVRAHVIVTIRDSEHVDAGVAWEEGAAYMLGKDSVAARFDGVRPLPHTGDNPMLQGTVALSCTSEEALYEWARTYRITLRRRVCMWCTAWMVSWLQPDDLIQRRAR